MDMQNAREMNDTLAPRKLRPIPPPNAGKPWSSEEDGRLRDDFSQGVQVAELARRMGRSRWAVESRLVKLGQLAGRGVVPFAQAAG